MGSIFILLSAIMVTILFAIYYNLDLNILKIIIIGFSASLLELIGFKGTDNLTLPIGISLISFILSV